MKIIKAIKLHFGNHRINLSHFWKIRQSIFTILKSPAKMINLSLNILSYTLRTKRIWGAPSVLMIEVSGRCNLHCPVCPRSFCGYKRKEGIMTYEYFKNIIDDIGDKLTLLLLWNYGEPFINQDILRMISYSKSKGIIVSVNTNGMLLNPQLIDGLVDSGLDMLSFSLDSTDPTTYQKIRQGGDLRIVLRNIKYILQRKNDLKIKKPFITLQCLVMKENEEKLNNFLNAVQAIGADNVAFKSLGFCNHSEIKPHMPRNHKYIRKAYKSSSNALRCKRLYVSSVITWDGGVYPCCRDIFFTQPMGKISDQQPLSKVWNNSKYMLFRQKTLENYKTLEICANCYSQDFDSNAIINTLIDK